MKIYTSNDLERKEKQIRFLYTIIIIQGVASIIIVLTFGKVM